MSRSRIPCQCKSCFVAQILGILVYDSLSLIFFFWLYHRPIHAILINLQWISSTRISNDMTTYIMLLIIPPTYYSYPLQTISFYFPLLIPLQTCLNTCLPTYPSSHSPHLFLQTFTSVPPPPPLPLLLVRRRYNPLIHHH